MGIMIGVLTGTALLFSSSTFRPAAPQVIPTVFEAGHFYAVPQTSAGQTLKLLVDTGGQGGSGLYVLNTATAKRLHLNTHNCLLGGQPFPVTELPHFATGRGLPPPVAGPCGKVALLSASVDDDGILGAGYLPGRIWTFDYRGHRLLMEGKSWRPSASAHANSLGFPHNPKGQKATGMARITIHIDGQPIDMLLDTGATAHPTTKGEKGSKTPTFKGFGVTSYITTSVLDRWHKKHPVWRVVTDGDDLLGPKRGMRLIQVPKVQIAGWSVGPLWFTERPDHNFHDFMSRYTDKTVEGSLGGNVFRHFVMTIDYPKEKAYFRCVRGCAPIATPPPAP